MPEPSTRARSRSPDQPATPARYRVLTGVVYPTNPHAPKPQWKLRKVAAGAIVDDIPPGSVAWLIEQKIIERVKEED